MITCVSPSVEPEAAIATPEKSQWMQCPKTISEYPGLAYISTLQELIIVETRDSLHNIIGTQGTAYTIFNNDGQKVFLAVREQRCNKFKVKIYNSYGNEVIKVQKPWKLCLNEAFVWAPPGNYVGCVKEVRKCINTYHVKNKSGAIVLKIKAEGFNRFVYSILSGDDEVGVLKNNWGFAAVQSDKNYGISFRDEAREEEKAVLLGALFLIGSLKY